MEQRIEVFKATKGAERTLFDKVKTESDDLLNDGWFVHQMVSETFQAKHPYTSIQLMVVYRRKA